MRQPYLTRLALGRSAYELPQWPEGDRPQESNTPDVSASEAPRGQPGVAEEGEYVQSYDLRGHPENQTSRANARRLRRAQNDILTTIGVCVSVDKDGKLVPSSSMDSDKEEREKNKLASIISENEFGFWLSAAQAAALLLTSSCATCIRQDVETFPHFSEFSFLGLIQLQLRYKGLLRTFFSGFPAACVFDLLDTAREFATLELRDKLIERFANHDVPARRRRRAKRVISLLVQVLDSLLIMATSPLLVFAIVSRLGVILSVSQRSLTFLSLALFPSIPTRWDFRSSLRFLMDVGKSPIALYLGMRYVMEPLEMKIRRYAFSLVPRPDCPDEYSRMSIDMELSNSISLSMSTGSFREEVENDIAALRIRLMLLKSQISQFRRRFLRGIQRLTGSQAAEPGAESQQPRIVHIAVDDANGHLSSSLARRHPNFDTAAPQPSSPSTRTPSPSLSASSDEEDVLMRALEEQTTVQITTRTGSTDTLHMNVEVNGTAPGAPVFTSSFSASPRPTIVETVEVERVIKRKHRITSLTLHSSESLSILLATTITTLIRLPFETLLVRSIAHLSITNVLATVPPSELGSVIADVRANLYPQETWFGYGLRAGGWRGVTNYMKKVLLCVGVESAMSFGIWQVGCGIARWAGRKWYSWGRL
ncbi:hypothetical protein MMC30_008405 [Trapelia coarctata]|nr:hypothetical protein [Trapelia coarctata]